MGRFDDVEPFAHSPEPGEEYSPAARYAARTDESLRAFGVGDGTYTPTNRTNDAVTGLAYVAGDWMVRWVLTKQHGVVVARSVTLEPMTDVTPPGGVTQDLLRELRPAKASADGADLFPRDEPSASPTPGGTFAQLQARWALREIGDLDLPEPPPKRVGRPALSEDHIAAVAEAYLEELNNGAGVLRRLGERFGRDANTMRDQVRIARRRGFLTAPQSPGRKGADAGPALIAYRQRRSQEAGE